MSNNKQSSVEWLKHSLEEYGDSEKLKITWKDFDELIRYAKAMHKEEIIKAINEVSENNVKYANMIISSWSQIEGELFMHNTKLAEQYYKETFNNK